MEKFLVFASYTMTIVREVEAESKEKAASILTNHWNDDIIAIGDGEIAQEARVIHDRISS